MLVGTDICVYVVFVWKETGGNPLVLLGDQITISCNSSLSTSNGFKNVVSYYPSLLF